MNAYFVFDTKYESLSQPESFNPIPDIAYLFKHECNNQIDDDIFFMKKERLLYSGGIKFTEREEESINEFYAFGNKNDLEMLTLLKEQNLSEANERGLVLKFIYDAKFEIYKAIELLKDYLAFFKKTFPLHLQDKTFDLLVI